MHRRTLRNLDRVLGTSKESKPRLPRPRPPKPQRPGRPQRPKPSPHWARAEVVNARLATAGQLVGPLVYADTGLDLAHQLERPECWALIATTTLYVALASRITRELYDAESPAAQLELGFGQASMLLWVWVAAQLVAPFP